MRTVEDAEGRRYLLLKRSRESSLVRDVATGEHRHLPTDELTVVAGTSPLATAAESVPPTARRLLAAVPDDRTLGLLVALEATDGLAARSSSSRRRSTARPATDSPRRPPRWSGRFSRRRARAEHRARPSTGSRSGPSRR